MDYPARLFSYFFESKHEEYHLNVTQIKVVHDIGHENLFEESDIGIVLALEERVAPGVVLIEQLN